MERTEFSKLTIKVECNDDVVTIKKLGNRTIENGRIVIKDIRPIPHNKIEIRLFDEDEIGKLQSIATQIYARKRQERECVQSLLPQTISTKKSKLSGMFKRFTKVFGPNK